MNITMRVEGEGITRLAREQCFYNFKFDFAMNLLQQCLQTDQLEDNEIAGLAFAVLDGRAEIKGTYPDGDYRFEYLEEKDEKWDIAKMIEKIRKQSEDKEKELRELQQKYFFAIERMTEWEIRKMNDEYFEMYEERMFEDIEAAAERPLSDPLESYIKRMTDDKEHSTEDFGWIEPDGTFHAVRWGEHQKWADDWCRNNLPEEEYERIELFEAGDTLIERGWILLHNPAMGIAVPTRDENREMTKAQKEFLYDYYIERDCRAEANAIWK